MTYEEAPIFVGASYFQMLIEAELIDERCAVGPESSCGHALCAALEVGAVFADARRNDAPVDEESEDLATQAVPDHAFESCGKYQTAENDVGSAVQAKAE